MKKWLGGVRGEDNYFINYADGAPYFSSKSVYYHGDYAADHARKMVKMMKNNGIKISSYFISSGTPWDGMSIPSRECTVRMLHSSIRPT